MKDPSIRLSTAQGEFLSVRSASAEVRVDGPLSRARLVITFHNDLGRTLEGDLVFPLPPKAALRELVVKLGGRTIQGKIKGRKRAQAEYQRAIGAGQSAALGESEGEDLARLRIAPIEHGEDVEVALTVDQILLPIADGHRLIVPLTYMPRYVEGGSTLKETEAAALARPRPLTLAARANVKVRIEHGGSKAPAIRCTSHKTKTTAGARATDIEVADAPLDRDLQIEIADRPKGEKPALWIRHDPSEGPDQNGPTTAVAIVPPAFADEGPTIARSVTFLVDRSGSMGGGPMDSAIRAVRGALRALGPEDRFNVIAFDNALEALASAPVPFDDDTLAAADTFISGIHARGGTDASMALEAALEPKLNTSSVAVALKTAPKPDQTYRLRILVFMTDGDVASAAKVIATAGPKLVDTRVHVLGIGDAVNHNMLAEIATLGGGTYTPVSTNEDLERGLARLKNAMTAPLWTGIRVLIDTDGERRTPKMLEPPGSIDLFASEPVIFAFRGPINKNEKLVLVGQRVDGEDQRIAAELTIPADAREEGAATLWALARNQRLSYHFYAGDDDTLEGLGKAFGVVNRQVALVGVHADERGTEIEGRVPVVLPMPSNAAEEIMARSLVASSPRPAGSAPSGPPVAAKPRLQAPAPAMGAPPPPPPMSAPAPAAPPPPPALRAPPRSRTLDTAAAQHASRSAPEPAQNAPASPSLTNDEAGLRALLLHQKADGLFASDAGVTLVAIAALVGRGHTAREGLFRAELRRTTTTLKSKASSFSGHDKLFALLALALLTMPHGDDAPEGLPEAMARALEGISLADLPSAQAKISAAFAALPGAPGAPLAAQIKRVFL